MKIGRDRQTGNQNTFNQQSSGHGDPYRKAGGAPFGGGTGNAGASFGSGADGGRGFVY